MIIQLEDCVDVLRSLYGNRFDFVFFFDHSSGHNHLRPDGLNVNEMNKGYGGSQSKMRDSKIENNTYLGPHSRILQVGDIQKMCFQSNDPGPFWLLPEQRNTSKNDCESQDSETKKYTKRELLTEIKNRTGMQPQRGTLKEIQKVAIANDLPIEYERRKIKEGWVGKAKGMLQVLYEREFIDTEKVVSYYQVNGKKDDNGTTIPGTSLKEMIRTLPDFEMELTLLQYRAQQLNVRVECSPKYHPEIAGEGIEFAWGLSKNTYQKLPLRGKANKEVFYESVRKSLDTETVLTREWIQSFAKQH